MWHSAKSCSSTFDLGPLMPKIYFPKLALWVIESFIVYMDVCHGSVGQSVRTKTCMWVGLTLVAMATTFGLDTESSCLPACLRISCSLVSLVTLPRFAVCKCSLVVFVSDEDGTTDRIGLLSYGCAYRRRSHALNSISSGNVVLEEEISGCRSVTASASPIRRLLASIADSEHGVLPTSSDITGQLCHCHTDNCNSATRIRFSTCTQIISTATVLFHLTLTIL